MLVSIVSKICHVLMHPGSDCMVCHSSARYYCNANAVLIPGGFDCPCLKKLSSIVFVACRVTPKGCKPVEANTATKAWSALFTSQDSARALGYSGAKQFGLQHPRVQRLLQGMPGAARCERYAAWPSQPPPVPHLVGLNSNMQTCQNCECHWQLGLLESTRCLRCCS